MKKIITILLCLLFISCNNTVQKSNGSERDSLCVVDNTYEVDVCYPEGYSEEDFSFVETETIFRPVSATISDSEGTFSSSDFDCPNMTVCDKGNTIQLSWGGEIIPLYKGNSPDTYSASQSKPGTSTSMKFVAYRSSNTGSIYLVTCTTKSDGQSVEINFKP